MKRNTTWFIIAVVVLAVLTWWAYTIVAGDKGFSGKTSTISEAETDFGISDTASVTKIIITNQDHQKAVLTKAEPGLWRLNDEYMARIDAINVILNTAKRIKAREKVSEQGKENILKNMAVKYNKVEYFAGDTWLKTWYVGHPTKDADGSFMILETPENGKAENPYITHIPGFSGELSAPFFTDPYEWRDHAVFRYDVKDIASVEFYNSDSSSHNYRINVLGENLFEMKDGSNKPVKAFDTVAVRAFLLNFKNINFLTLNKGHLSKEQEDSLRKAQPFIRLVITNKQKVKDELKIYHKKVQPGQVDLEGKPYRWDIDLAFARLRTGEIAVIQFGHFAKILWPLEAFTMTVPPSPR